MITLDKTSNLWAKENILLIENNKTRDAIWRSLYDRVNNLTDEFSSIDFVDVIVKNIKQERNLKTKILQYDYLLHAHKNWVPEDRPNFRKFYPYCKEATFKKAWYIVFDTLLSHSKPSDDKEETDLIIWAKKQIIDTCHWHICVDTLVNSMQGKFSKWDHKFDSVEEKWQI